MGFKIPLQDLIFHTWTDIPYDVSGSGMLLHWFGHVSEYSLGSHIHVFIYQNTAEERNFSVDRSKCGQNISRTHPWGIIESYYVSRSLTPLITDLLTCRLYDFSGLISRSWFGTNDIQMRELLSRNSTNSLTQFFKLRSKNSLQKQFN